MRVQHNKAILDELALRDFGTIDVSHELRGKARALARMRGCTPREALDRLLKVVDEKQKKHKEHQENKMKRIKRLKAKIKKMKTAEVGRPPFRGIVSGGLPSLGKRR